MKVEDQRMDRMIEIADLLDVPLDHVVEHMARCSQSRFLMLSSRPDKLPRYMKSSFKP